LNTTGKNKGPFDWLLVNQLYLYMKKILIVSSDRHLLGILKHALSFRGYTVDTIDDPYATRLLIHVFAPELLIIDFILNDHNGGAISHQVKSDPETNRLPVILLSDYFLETNYPSRFGCDIVIEKTDDLGPLIDGVRHLFNEKEVVFQ
jgi:PleD family two-component response regulator